MIAVQYPEPQFRIKNEKGKQYIFDTVRKIWVLLTEEEWVRQNFVNYLITKLNYPSTVIALEKEISLNDLKKRFDILVYDKDHKPWMLIECKEPKQNLGEDVLQQVLRYNISVPVKYIVITNGNTTVGWKKESELTMLERMPEWR
jgi:hypothetical protein